MFQILSDQNRIPIEVTLNQLGNLNSHENILINRGSGHVHGVIWSDIDKYLETATTLEKKHLKDAMKMLMEDKAPSSEQSEAMATYVDNFVSVSLRDPATRDIVKSVNVHNHTHTCRKKGSKCRFPVFQVAGPLQQHHSDLCF